jgi:hypothetical protein
MTKEDYIVLLVSAKYSINIRTPYKEKKEAVDVCAYMLRKHTNMKHTAIALTLGSTSKSTNLIRCISAVKKRRQEDENFNRKLSVIDMEISQNDGVFLYSQA